MKTWHAVLIGLAVAALAIVALEVPLRGRRSDLEEKLQAQDAALRQFILATELAEDQLVAGVFEEGAVIGGLEGDGETSRLRATVVQA